ncbi:MAG TPA: hypothetical protein EYG97_02565 [Arcobacter sp.]|nr:hypothetical protein [Arcobacter sp.]HIP55884.1 hypothetical protein [Arcobacter sp.]
MKQTEIEKPAEFLKLIAENKNNYLYNDHPSDGIDLFTDEQIELYGWHAIAFDDITYRKIAEFIEEHCDGEFVFNDHPMGFNAYAVLSDVEKARVQIKEFIVNIITKLDLSELDDDQKEALKFFGISK